MGLITKECVQNEIDNHVLSVVDMDVELPKREICYAIRKNSVGYNFLQDFINEIKK